MKILVSGATGLIGTALVDSLRATGHTVGRLVRPGGDVGAGDVRWDPSGATIDLPAMEATDGVVHLSGASIAGGRWTTERKLLLRSSRVASTRVLVDALSHLDRKPRVLICASAIGYYGDRGDEVLTEKSESGRDFLSQLARDWEREAKRAESFGARVVSPRFGVILSTKGGALPRMLPPFRLGLGGRLGSGEQWMSWITLEDTIGVLQAALGNESFQGPINTVAPNPVKNAEFTRVLARVLHRPAIFPAPAFALRLLLGEMADALLLSSQRVQPEKLSHAGHRFRNEQLQPALEAILTAKE